MSVSSHTSSRFGRVLSQVSRQKKSESRFPKSSAAVRGSYRRNDKSTLEEKFSKYFRD